MIFFLLGLSVGLISFYFLFKIKKGGFYFLAQEILHETELEAERQRNNVALELKELKINCANEHKALLEKNSKMVSEGEERIHKKELLLEKKLEEIERKETRLKESQDHLNVLINKVESELISLTQLTKQEARELFLAKIKSEAESEARLVTKEIVSKAQVEGEQEAKRIIVTALNRISLPCAHEVLTMMIPLSQSEMKGRIIGREGRNIRIFEQEAGVNLLIDDIPGFIVISGFDPLRKEIAKNALSELLKEGKIFPTRIVEAIRAAKEKMTSDIIDIGKETVQSLSLFNVNPHLVELLGKLKFITVAGQPILNHVVEVAHIMALFASECGLNIHLAKRIGLLHDIGKAFSHEKEGSHATIGAEVCQKFGESELVYHAVASHHANLPPLSLEEALLYPANAISKERMGARIDSLDHYLKRISSLEKIAADWEGVERSFALHTGKEICVIVKAEEMDDAASSHLLKQITKKIEEEHPFLGKVKITLIREKKFVEYSNREG